MAHFMSLYAGYDDTDTNRVETLSYNCGSIKKKLFLVILRYNNIGREYENVVVVKSVFTIFFL